MTPNETRPDTSRYFYVYIYNESDFFAFYMRFLTSVEDISPNRFFATGL